MDLWDEQIHCTGLSVAHGRPGTSTGHCSLTLNCFFYSLCRGRTTPLALTHLHLLFSASPLKGSQDFRRQGVSAGDFVRECTDTAFLSHRSAELLYDLHGIQLLGVSAHQSLP